ncbi:MAG TPA: dTDP-4-dehydrorhamnose 3,5-epimerase [Pyrinomonadaceae bacterium]|jgi:dTDP-4-dehydrorhamnose 3,5-epimerase|nr:dTDP-4-dehydrorhamnose 3,5-epimerase [Pyrinomonadaceae bacterium]
MITKPTKLPGAFIIEPETFADERGFFARVWSEREFAALGVESDFIECNLSFNKQAGTLRGMHYQAAPYGQAKLVRCTRGSIFDVGVDLREDSPTFRQWIGFELSAENRLMLYLPGNFGHGYLSLEDNTEVNYQVTNAYAPEHARGFRWDDPAFQIQWPAVAQLNINDRDRSYPDFKL